MVQWCTIVPLQSFHLSNFLQKKPHDDGGVVTYDDLARRKQTGTYLHVGGTRVIRTLLLSPPVTPVETLASDVPY